MRLTSFTDYGLRMASAPERLYSTAELADEPGLSRNHLTKNMQQFTRGDMVEARRGSGGVAVLCCTSRPGAFDWATSSDCLKKGRIWSVVWVFPD